MAQTSFQKRNLAEQVADSLSTTIDRQGWDVGHRLPPVRDLAKRFDVSSYTAHTAIQLLAKRGVIGLQPRHGAFVRRVLRVPAEPKTERNQIGIVWPIQPGPDFNSSRDDWSGHIIRSFELELHDLGLYSTVVGYVDAPQFASRLESLRPHLGGILTFTHANITNLLEKLDTWKLPWLTLNPMTRQTVHNFVGADNQADFAKIGYLLAKNGFTHVLELTSRLTESASSMDKHLGLFEGFAQAGACTQDIEVVACDGYHEANGYEAMRTSLSRARRPQVVVTHGDFLALGAIRAYRELGVDVPGDVGVLSSTGLKIAELSHPTLSVVMQPMREIGVQAARMLAEMIRKGTHRIIGRRIPGKLVLRESLSLPTNEISSPVVSAETSAVPQLKESSL